MHLKIYQIDMDRDKDHAKFRELTGDLTANADIYDEVFDGVVDCQSAEDVYRMFNTTGHPLHRGHSLSVSDVVIMDDKKMICQPIGFDEVKFDESLAHKPDNLIRALYVEPGKQPVTVEVQNELRSLQRAVQGLIELVPLDDKTSLICNEEGKLEGMQGNRRLDSGAIIAGPFLVVGDDGSNFCSLTDAQQEQYENKFKEPHQISQEEVQADMGFTFIPL